MKDGDGGGQATACRAYMQSNDFITRQGAAGSARGSAQQMFLIPSALPPSLILSSTAFFFFRPFCFRVPLNITPAGRRRASNRIMQKRNCHGDCSKCNFAANERAIRLRGLSSSALELHSQRKILCQMKRKSLDERHSSQLTKELTMRFAERAQLLLLFRRWRPLDSPGSAHLFALLRRAFSVPISRRRKRKTSSESNRNASPRR